MSRRTTDDDVGVQPETILAEDPCPITDASVFSSTATEKLFEDAARRGFKHVLGIYELVRPGHDNARIVVHNWPQAWVKAYRKHAYMSVDPVVFHLLTAEHPFAWRDLPPPSPAQLDFMKNAAAQGLVDGVSGPLHFKGSSFGIFTGASPTPLSTETLTAGMAWLSMQFQILFSDVRNQLFPPAAQTLGPDTLAIARHYHQGMQAQAIADRQGISTWGVIYHLKELRRKLGEKSNKAACAKAEALGLFCDVQGLLEAPQQPASHSNPPQQMRKTV